MIKIEILDGKNTIGGTKILINFKDFSFFLDFGKNFKKFSDYFEEFIKPRTSTGIYDLWKLNLIPKIINIYREDLIPPYLNCNFDRKENILGVFISHAHLDHSGLISLLKEDIPIITSSSTIKFLKAIEDINPETFNQFTVVKKRVWSDDFGELVSKSSKGSKKLNEDEIYEEKRKFIEIKDENYQNDYNGIKFYSYKVDHSIFGSLGFFIEIDGKGIAYTGDIRFHGKNKIYSEKFVEALKKFKPTILITEGTRKKSEKEKKFEENVYNASKKVIENYKGKPIIADFAPRNIERLEIFLKIAKESDRKLLITYKDAYLLHLLKEENNIIDDEDLYIIHEKKLDNKNYLKEIKENYKNKIKTPKEINENIDKFIFCYSYYDLINLIDFEIKDGTYIYSTSEAYTEEQEIDIKRLFNWLKFLNLKPFGIDLRDEKPIFTGDYHSSGHASFDDIINMIKEVNPEYIIPVHTENIDDFLEIFGDDRVIKDEIFEL
jgi:ribonuclease J